MFELICWDTCVFLAKFKRESDKPLDVIDAYLERVRDAETNMIVSVICAAEILDYSGSKSRHSSKFQSFVKDENVILVNVDMRVARLAAEFREKGAAAREQGVIKKGFKAADAIIAATASLYKAEVLHTFDPVLCGLSETEFVNGLRIEPPSFDDEDFPLFVNNEN